MIMTIIGIIMFIISIPLRTALLAARAGLQLAHKTGRSIKERKEESKEGQDNQRIGRHTKLGNMLEKRKKEREKKRHPKTFRDRMDRLKTMAVKSLKASVNFLRVFSVLFIAIGQVILILLIISSMMLLSLTGVASAINGSSGGGNSPSPIIQPIGGGQSSTATTAIPAGLATYKVGGYDHLYLFRQGEFHDDSGNPISIPNSGGYSIGGYGCGLCSLTTAYNYLCNADYNPISIIEAGIINGSDWDGNGMSWSAPDHVKGLQVVVDNPAGVNITSQFTEACKTYLVGHPERVMLLSTGLREGHQSVFCGPTSGHMILCYKADSDGFYICNSCAGIENYFDDIPSYEDTPRAKFPYGDGYAGLPYDIKCYWVLEKE